jgi:superfamily I DNA/RNA helicase
MAKESWYINESELDDFQVKIVRRSLNSSFIVKGCAGSGKTVLALWRAKEIAEQGNHDYLIIVFTKALKKFIEDGIHTIGVDESKVMYHWEWIVKGKVSADYIIVDEVQDFDTNELRELQNAAKKHLILFGDSAQQIYYGLPDKGKLMSMEEIQLQTGIPMTNLVINHRLPKKIARVAEKVTKSPESMYSLVESCKKEGINKPRLIECSSFEEQLDYIKDVVKAQNYTDVGILFPTNNDVEKAKTYYNKINWGVEVKVRRAGEDYMDLDFKTDNPKLMTYHSAKGLQFEAVFLPKCEVANESDRNPLYVALTRSYRDLFILYSNQLSPFIANIDSNLFEYHNEKNKSSASSDLPF